MQVNMSAQWSKIGEAIYNADAQKVAEEILSIGPEAKPRQIVEKARDEATELHKCFDWDDTIAAEKWRIQQARHVTSCLVIHREEVRENTPEIRYFHVTDKGGYKTTEYIYKRPDEYKRLLQNAYADLEAFKRKYKNLQELDWLIAQFP